MRLPKKSLLLLVPATAALVLCIYSVSSALIPKDLDLTHARSTLIKKDKGKPAQLLWWRASEEPHKVRHFTKEDFEADGSKIGGEFYTHYRNEWTVNRWLKVAEIGNRTISPRRNEERLVKVYLVDPLPPKVMSGRFYLAKRADLKKNRIWWRLPPHDEEE